jgi:eukaryotic-like serine/threonine-protein kinase
MEPDKWERVKAVYHAALDLDPGLRAAFLERTCGDERDIQREVESLLAQNSDDSFLNRPAWQIAAPGGDESDSSNRTAGSQQGAGPNAGDGTVRRGPLVWVVYLAAALVVAGSGYGVWRLPQAVPSFGWLETQRGGQRRVSVVSPTGPAAGKLRPGDLLISLNGDHAVARGGTRPYRLVLPIGDGYRVQVSRAGVASEYVLRVGATHRHWQVLLPIGLAWCAIGVFVGCARPGDRLARIAFAAATWIGTGYLKVALTMPLYGMETGHVLGYHFFYLFPEHPPRGREWKQLLWLLYAATAVSLAYGLYSQWLLWARGPQAVTPLLTGPSAPMLDWLLPATAALSILGSAVVAVHKYRSLEDSAQRRRFHWIAFGAVVGLVPPAASIALDFVGVTGVSERWLPSAPARVVFGLVANAFSIAIPLSVAYSVVRHQVFGVKVAIRRGVQYLLARGALRVLLAAPSAALLYTLVVQRHRTVTEIVAGSSAYLYWILALGLSLKFRVTVLRWIDWKFFREQYDREQVVFNLVDELGQLDSAEQISALVCRQLERSLHPKSMHIWWRENGVMKLASTSDPSVATARFPISEGLLEKLRRLGTVSAVPLAPGTGVSHGESRWLAERGVRLILAMAAADGVEGILMLGEKQSEEPYSAGDTRLLHAVGQQTAVILDNLRLKGRVRDEQRIRHDVLAKLDVSLLSLMRECPACGWCYDSGDEICTRDGTALTFTLPVARTIEGKYRLDRLIGQGGMGAVYEARDLRLGRGVAVKVMLGGAFGHESALRRFRREAQAVARLNHPNIVGLYDYGELEGGGAYLVMERLHGATLRAEMKRTGIFPLAKTADWFEPMLDGLVAAHEQGVVHRDLKPENVLGARQVSGSLVVKILDFGLAKIRPLPTGTASHSLTEPGVVLGTLAYMAPEQLVGREVDQRADIYSSGVILVEMMTGCRPIAQAPDMPASYHLPGSVPNQAALDAVVQYCLGAAPNSRFPSAAELRAALIPALRRCDGAGTATSGR